MDSILGGDDPWVRLHRDLHPKHDQQVDGAISGLGYIQLVEESSHPPHHEDSPVQYHQPERVDVWQRRRFEVPRDRTLLLPGDVEKRGRSILQGRILRLAMRVIAS